MGTRVGSAYVTLMPSMKGFSASLSKDMGAAGQSAGQTFGSSMSVALEAETGKSNSALSKLGSAAKGVATAAVAGFTALTGAVATVGGAALSAYADYEQLVGGVDTLFKDASAKVQRYAENAYKTAGMSANTYMETVTSFSASLLQGLGGDTAKAAQIADLAVTDMSDNANKMGTSIDVIRQAYQGFAKDNYDMLDNLKLGYGGTQSEMARLINDSGVLGDSMKVTAETVKDVPFDKMIEAIHKVQTEMGITGTTAKEAATTIQGSIGMAKGAWDNFLTGIASEDADMTALTNQLLESIGAVATNVAPRVAQIGQGIINAFPAVLAGLGSALAPIVSEALAAAWNIAAQGLRGIGIPLPNVDATQVMTAFQQLADFFTGTIMPAFKPVVDAFANLAQTIIPLLMPLITQLGAILAGVAPIIATIMTAVVNVVTQIASFVMPILTQIIEWISANMPAIQAIVSSVMSAVQSVVTAVLGAVQAIWNVVWPAVKGVIDAVFPAIKQVIEGVMNAIQGVISVVTGIISGDWSAVWNGIKQIASSIWNSIKSLVSTAVNAVKSVISGALGIIQGIWSSAWNSVKSLFSSIWNGIKSAASAGIDAVVSTVTGIKDRIVGFFSGAGQWLVNSGRAILDGLASGISAGFDAVTGVVEDGLSFIRGLFPFSPAKRGPFSGHGYTTFSGKALMGDFADAIKSQAGKVVSATNDVMGMAQSGLSAQLTTSQSFTVSRSGGEGYGDSLAAIEALLARIADRDGNVYLDSNRVSAALAAHARSVTRGRGVLA